MDEQTLLSQPSFRILDADFTDERVLALLRLHLEFCLSPITSPEESIKYVLSTLR